MKTFDMTTVLQDLDGKDLQIMVAEGDKPASMTLRHVLIESLGGVRVGQQMSAKDKITAYNLMQRVHMEDSLALTEQEATFLADEVGKWAPPLVYGRVHDYLNGPGAEPPTEVKLHAT